MFQSKTEAQRSVFNDEWSVNMREITIDINNCLIDHVTIRTRAPVASVQFASRALNFVELINFYYDIERELSKKYGKGKKDTDENVILYKLDKNATSVSLRKFKNNSGEGNVFIFFGGQIKFLTELLVILEETKIEGERNQLNIINECDKGETIKAYKQASFETSLEYENSSLVGFCISSIINNIDNEFVEKASNEYYKPIEEHYGKYRNHLFWKEKGKVQELLELRQQIKEKEALCSQFAEIRVIPRT